jgi:hypothetical protein
MHTPTTLPALGAGLDLDELLEIAAEFDERGPLATIKGLLEGLRVRHQGDDTTLAILAAVEHYHLPMLLDGAMQ